MRNYILDRTNRLYGKWQILVDWKMKLVIMHNLFMKFASKARRV